MDGLMRLQDLLNEAGVEASLRSNPEISGVRIDSRQVKPGDLFLALAGAKDDGSRYAGDALARGAAAVLTDGDAHIGSGSALASGEVVRYPALRSRVGLLFDAWHGHPSRGMLAVGVTGTNGKSTITRLASSILKAAGRKPITLGTISYEVGDEAIPSDLTTPGPDAFFGMLAAGRDKGCDALAMEVSSHALSQERIRGVRFARAIFTNLTRDHMDYHKDFEDYFQAKKRLFSEHLRDDGMAILNLDDAYGARLARELAAPRLTFSRGKAWGAPGDAKADVVLVDARMSLSGTGFDVSFRGATHRFASRLVGGINLENLLAAVALGFSLDLGGDAIARGIADVTVPGRNQVFGLRGGAFAVVDYAHTPDALERVLHSLRPLTPGRLVCLFGCGGDRDRTKRPIMGGIAARLADRVFLTSDNPRTEDPGAILEEILGGMEERDKVRVNADRREAIREALDSLGAGDCLLVAGKGHEDYQILGTEKRHFSDQEEIASWMEGRRGA
jgi:UDP-N-acetylmuramoyl-L-alanyl-D-glutamate--2,6-diaminopimelate ligase